MKRTYATLALLSLSMLIAAPPGSLAAEAPVQVAARGTAPADDLALFYDEKELQVSTTRSPKPINQTAENVTIITASDIEAMNVHALADVLNRVPGFFINYQSSRVLDGFTMPTIQGSRQEHILYLMDGVRLNTASSGDVPLENIPIQAIKRIEVIKGPASAAWGSSLGGVVNILTKDTGRTLTPSGSLTATYGEGNTSELNGDAAGAFGRFSYYLYADRRDTDGLVANRTYQDDRLYLKTQLDLPRGMVFDVTVNHADPRFNVGDFQFLDTNEPTSDRQLFGTLHFHAPLAADLELDLGARRLSRDFLKTRSFLDQGLWPGAAPGDLLYREHWDETTSGASWTLAWTPSNHRLALGAEITRSEVEKDTTYGDWAQSNWWAPAYDPVGPALAETYGLYLNDTITWGRLSVTPGLRYDHHSISEELLSPSLGLTYRLRDDLLFRALANRGFLYPILSYLRLSDWAFTGNANMKPEIVTSYQLGLETGMLPYLHLKATLFQHDVQDSFLSNYYTWSWDNGADLRRQGVELEAETVTLAGFSALASLTYVSIQPQDESPNDSSTAAHLILRYEADPSLRAELAGHYVWWDTNWNVSGPTGSHAYSPLWDLSLAKTLCQTERTSTRLFVTLHNLGDVTQTNDNTYYQNPGRWIEAGLKFKY